MANLVWLALAAVAVIIVLLTWLLIRSIRKRRNNPAKKIRFKKLFNILMVFIMAVTAVAIVALNYLTLGYLTNPISAAFASTQGSQTDSTEEDWLQLAKDITEQGMVLLRNENNTLPLDTSSGYKINLLGYRAYDPIYSGSGSGSTSAADATDIVTALTNAGFEVNPAPIDEHVYQQVEGEDKGIGFSNAAFTIEEKPLDRYTGEASFDRLKEYSDTAVVVIGRTGGEGNDLTLFQSDDGKTYLQLSAEEEALLQQARSTFDKLIVVYNGANAMELGYLETYDVDAAIWAGIPGPNGFGALGKILSGEVNPSGRLVDTYVYDTNSAPATENFGDQEAANSEGAHYVDYVENIYVGYKWYETANAESAVITNTKTGTTYDYSDYDSIVQYPFGYGLSYTTFTQKITGGIADGDVLDPRGTVDVAVEVTNTGSTSGRDAVELYVSVPYTDYDKANSVEKSAVTLAGYAKTEELAPGASQTVTISVNAEDIASYDRTHDNGDGTTGSYMLDGGDYIFSVRSDSHNVIDERTMTLGASYFYAGDNKRSDDIQAAYNQFDDAARGIYLSRADGFANYSEAMASVSSDVTDTSYDRDYRSYDPAFDSAVTKTYVRGTDYDAPGNITLADMKGVDYDDPKWDDFIRQLSISDMENLTTGAVYGIGAASSVDKPYTMDTDGPLGISSMYVSTVSAVAYPCLPLLAATFNNDLAREYGNYMADQAHSIGVTGWYAPAMNIHRSAYEGRAFEYYSEDPVLSAGIGSYETLGAREKGLIVYIKHFALNEQETQRSGKLHTYANEQSIRETYLKPFEESVKFGGATGVMSSMNYIGDVYVSASEALCTEVLRNEWGFHGMVLTDMPQGAYQEGGADRSIRAGTDTWLALMNMSVSSSSDADIYYLQRASKNILYAEANADVYPVHVASLKTMVFILDAELAALFAVCLTAMISRNRFAKKQKAEADAASTAKTSTR